MTDSPHEISLTNALLERLRRERQDAHTRILALIEDLTDHQLSWRPGPRSPAIGFHVWHVARWEDYDRSFFENTPEIWRDRDLAWVWRFAPTVLGEADTGTEMGDDASGRLVLPGKTALLDYTRAAFEAMDQVMDELPSDSLLQPANNPQGHDRVSLVFDGLIHLNRHLGMIEALRGVLDLRGTATR